MEETGGRRRRRTPEVAEAEIVAAAEALLRERPFRELTVDEVMRRTDLSRPSFYVYFRDRHHLMLKVVEHIGAELRTMSQRWYTGSGDGPAQAREAMEGFVEVYAQHGAVLRALADAATDDHEVERVYVGLVESVRGRHHAPHREGDRGRPRDPARRRGDRAGARVDDGALPEPHSSAPAWTTVVDTLTTIWTRVLYGAPDAPSRRSARRLTRRTRPRRLGRAAATSAAPRAWRRDPRHRRPRRRAARAASAPESSACQRPAPIATSRAPNPAPRTFAPVSTRRPRCG